MDEAQRIYGNNENLILTGTKEAALRKADALIICTEWQNFRAPNLDLIKTELREAVIFDGRNMFDPKRMKENNFKYFAIGRGLSLM